MPANWRKRNVLEQMQKKAICLAESQIPTIIGESFFRQRTESIPDCQKRFEL
jgi:hypothetical protein